MPAIFAQVRDIYAKEGIRGLLTAAGRFFYWNFGIRHFYYHITYWLCDDSITVSVGGYKTRFGVESKEEFIRMKSLMGERPVLEDVLKELDEQSVFYDIGANVGLYACFAAQKIRDGDSVIAFEPHPINLSRLRANIELNRQNTQTSDCALTDASGTNMMKIANDRAGEGKHSLSPKGGDLEVRTERLDSVIGTSYPKPDVMKIDVEGGELEVIRGMSDLSPNKLPGIIFCEVHTEHLSKRKRDRLQELLRDYGYELKIALEQQHEYMLKATYEG